MHHIHPPHTHIFSGCGMAIHIKFQSILSNAKTENFKNPTGNATFFKIFHRESSGIEISKRNSNWKLIILCNLQLEFFFQMLVDPTGIILDIKIFHSVQLERALNSQIFPGWI